MNPGMIVSQTEDGMRLLRWFLRKFPQMRAGDFYKLCRGGQIRINSGRCRGNEIIRSDDKVRIPPTIEKYRVQISKAGDGNRFSLLDLENLRECIIHDDADIVVFNKPAGLATQGGTGIQKSVDKMASAMFPYDKISLVHRLDRETSGILIVAKNHLAATKLSAQFVARTAKKKYLAVLLGDDFPKHGLIDNYMVRGKIVHGDEKPDGLTPVRAITEYKVLDKIAPHASWVLFSPHTGRTHQLRIHAAQTLGAPILGDKLYGTTTEFSEQLQSSNLFLFAWQLSFIHPKTDSLITISAKVPEFMKELLHKFNLAIPEV